MTLTADTIEEIRGWIDTMIRWVADHPEDCIVNFVQGEDTTVIDVKPHPEDFGRLIGLQGRLATGVRAVLGSFQRKYRHHIHFRIIELDKTGQLDDAQRRRSRQSKDGQAPMGGSRGDVPRLAAGAGED